MPDTADSRDIVLIVDDTPENLGFLTGALDQTGLTVLVATDGDSALELVQHITPDLVLMDAVMPGLDGFETCRRLKAEQALSHVPVIFMTGLSETEHVVRGLQSGGVDYVTKPIVVPELLARIRVHLANARSAHASRVALDATGRFLLATDAEGQLLWCTPKAEELLRALFGHNPDPGSRLSLPEDLVQRLRLLRQNASLAATVPVIGAGQNLEFSYLSPTGPNEFLYRLTEGRSGNDEATLQNALALTRREAEVLLWISRGKSNHEISDILGISHRTVGKHLEQVFTKLGVENRAGAATRAVKVLTAMA